jgi:UDP-GlcNAc:undecaprenyl-phosphate/decaprenyl-phosphate GlcNAc-1-phosphate transferase
MTFPFNVYLLAFAGGFLASTLTLPAWRKRCLRTGLVDDPGHRKIHESPIPLAGGLAVMTGLLVPPAIAAVFLKLQITEPRGLLDPNTVGLFGYGFTRRTIQLAAILLGALGMVGVGWLDDKHELRPAAKFGGQLLIATLVAAAGVRITLFVDNILFSYAITVLWILTVTNACNFMDNMNGLCAGLGLIGGWCFAWSAAVNGQYLVTSIALLTCGALLGFLPFNFPKAKAFLGDAGSHLVGYVLAVLAILPHFYSRGNSDTLAVLKPLLILAVILGDLVWVVFLRWRIGRPFYVGDNNHLSHRLVRRGLSRTQAVLVIWLIAAAAGWLSFL